MLLSIGIMLPHYTQQHEAEQDDGGENYNPDRDIEVLDKEVVVIGVRVAAGIDRHHQVMMRIQTGNDKAVLEAMAMAKTWAEL